MRGKIALRASEYISESGCLVAGNVKRDVHLQLRHACNLIEPPSTAKRVIEGANLAPAERGPYAAMASPFARPCRKSTARRACQAAAKMARVSFFRTFRNREVA